MCAHIIRLGWVDWSGVVVLSDVWGNDKGGSRSPTCRSTMGPSQSRDTAQRYDIVYNTL